MVSKVPVSGIERKDKRGGGDEYTESEYPEALRSSSDQCSGGSRAFDSDGATEDKYLGLYWKRVKGKSALRIFSVFRDLRRKRYWGNHLWTPGYCVGTVGRDEEQIRKYDKISGKSGTQTGRVSIWKIEHRNPGAA